MARLFIRLKVRLIRNGMSITKANATGLVLGAFFGLPVALIGFALLALVPSAGGAADSAVAVGLCSALFVGWVLFPLFSFGVDETVDPARLVLLPLTRWQLVSGMLAASVVGVAPVATLICLLGAVPGFSTSASGALVVFAAVALHLALCIAASRAVTTSLSGRLRSRRGRDVVVVASSLMGFAFYAATQFLSHAAERGDAVALGGVVDVLRWLPPGLAGAAMTSARRGETLAGAGQLALVAMSIAGLLWWWASSLERNTTTATADPPPPVGSLGGATAVDRFAGMTTRRPAVAAVVAKELRYWRRDPRRRAALLPMLFMIAPLAMRFGDVRDAPEFVLAAAFIAWPFGFAAMNHLGQDGPAFSSHVITGTPAQDYVTGKAYGTIALLFPFVVITAAGLAALSGGWVYIPLTLLLALAFALVQQGVGAVVSVKVPQPLPQAGGNIWRTSNTGQGCVAGLVGVLALGAELLFAAPFAVLMVLGLDGRAWLLALTPAVALLAAWGVWILGRDIAASQIRDREPELLDLLAPRRAD